jgi:hypothetical protein
MWFGNFTFIRCGFVARNKKNGLYPQNCKILKNIYFTVVIEEEGANFEPSAHEPTIRRKNRRIPLSREVERFSIQ